MSASSLRLGSLEILIALAAFAAIATRLRSVTLAPRPAGIRLHVRVYERTAAHPREVSVSVGDGLPAGVIGRSSGAQVRLSDPEVSRRHAQLELVRGVLYLSDAGSSNGTFLNGNRLRNEGVEVRAGDDIDVGNTRLTIVQTEPQTWT